MLAPIGSSFVPFLIFLSTQWAGGHIVNPRSLDNCVLWLDGSDVDGDFASGGSLVGGTTWIDKSTESTATAVQTTADQTPEVVAEELNGLSVVRFDGTDFMDVDSAAFGMLNDVAGCTLIGLAKSTVQPTRGGQRVLMISSGTNAAGSRAGLNIFDSFGTSLGGSGDLGLAGRRLDSDEFQRIEGGEAVLGEFVQWTGVFDYASGTLKLYVDGVLETEVTNFQTAGRTSPSDSLNIRLGADAALDAVRGLFTGDVAELIAYNRVLPDSEREDVEEYLLEKWLAPPVPLELTVVRYIPSPAPSVELLVRGSLGTYRLTSSVDLETWVEERSVAITIAQGSEVEVVVPLDGASRFFRLEVVP